LPTFVTARHTGGSIKLTRSKTVVVPTPVPAGETIRAAPAGRLVLPFGHVLTPHLPQGRATGSNGLAGEPPGFTFS
jgi:hypothetical protein